MRNFKKVNRLGMIMNQNCSEGKKVLCLVIAETCYNKAFPGLNYSLVLVDNKIRSINNKHIYFF